MNLQTPLIRNDSISSFSSFNSFESSECNIKSNTYFIENQFNKTDYQIDQSFRHSLRINTEEDDEQEVMIDIDDNQSQFLQSRKSYKKIIQETNLDEQNYDQFLNIRAEDLLGKIIKSKSILGVQTDLQFINIIDFNQFTHNDIKKFNNDNIMQVLFNIARLKTGKNDLFIDLLLQFLEYFQLNYLKIGNIPQNKYIGHQQAVKSVTWAQNDEIICSASNDNLIKLWDLEKNYCYHTFQEHTDKVLCLNTFGNILASGSKDQLIKIYDLNALCYKFTLQGHKGKVNSVVFNQTGEFLCSGSEDHTIIIWNIANQNLISQLKGHKDGVICVDWSPDDKIIVSSSHDKHIHFWSFETRELIYKIKGSQDGIYAVKFSPNGKQLASSNINTIYIWDTQQRKCVTIFEGHENIIRSLSFSPCGNVICSASEDNTIRIWNLQTRQCEAILENTQNLNQDDFGIISAQFSKNGTQICSGDFQNQVIIWKIHHNVYAQIYEGHTDEILQVCFSHNQLYLGSSSGDCQIRIWHFEQEECVGILKGHEHPVTCFKFSPNDQLICSASTDKQIIIWDLNNYQKIRSLIGHRHNVTSVDFSPCGKYICSGSLDKTIRIWDVQLGFMINKCLGHEDGVSQVIWDDENGNLISCSYDNTIKVWTNQNLIYINEINFEGHLDAINDICFGLTNNIIFSGGKDMTIRVWNQSQKQCKAILKGHTDEITCLSYSKVKNILCSASEDQTIRIWNGDSLNCQAIIYDYVPNNGCVYSIAFSQDGEQFIQNNRFLCSGDSNGIMIIRQTYNLHNFIMLMQFISALEKENVNDDMYENLSKTDSLKLLLKKISPQIIKTLLPMGLSVLHYALYKGDQFLLENVIEFAIQNRLYIEPSFDEFKNTPFTLALGNRTALQLLLEYYSHPDILGDANFNPQGSQIFSDILPILLKERIPGIHNFLDSRCFEALGEKPKVCEYFKGIKTESFDSIIPSKSEYQKMIPQDTKVISNKSQISYKIYDISNILEINSKLIQEFANLPSNSLIFQTKFLNDMIDYKWKKYARSYFVKDAILNIVFLLIFQINAVIFFPNKILDEPYINENFNYYFSTSTNIILIIMIFYFIFQKYRRIIHDRKIVFDFITYFLVTFCILMEQFLPMDDYSYARAMFAFTLIVIWCRILLFLKGFKEFSYLIRLIMQTFIDIIPFCIVVTCFIIMFGLALFIVQDTLQDMEQYNINQKVEEEKLEQKSVLQVLQVVYCLLIYNVDWFIHNNGLYLRPLADLYYYFLSMFIMVVLLNLILAILFETYDKVINLEKNASLYERLILIQTIDKNMTKKEIDKLNNLFKKYLVIAQCFQEIEGKLVNQDQGISMREKVQKIECSLNSQQFHFNQVNKSLKKVDILSYIQNKLEQIETLENKNNTSLVNIEELYEKNLSALDLFKDFQLQKDKFQELSLKTKELLNLNL